MGHYLKRPPFRILRNGNPKLAQPFRFLESWLLCNRICNYRINGHRLLSSKPSGLKHKAELGTFSYIVILCDMCGCSICYYSPLSQRSPRMLMVGMVARSGFCILGPYIQGMIHLGSPVLACVQEEMQSDAHGGPYVVLADPMTDQNSSTNSR